MGTLPLLNVPMPTPPRMEPKDGDWRGRRLWTLASKTPLRLPHVPLPSTTLRLLHLPLPTRHVARQKVMIGNGSGVRWTGAMIGMDLWREEIIFIYIQNYLKCLQGISDNNLESLNKKKKKKKKKKSPRGDTTA